MEKIFEPAEELEVKKDFESNEELEAALPSTWKKGFQKWKKSCNFDKTSLIDDNCSILRDRIFNLDCSLKFEIWRFLFTEEMIDQIVYQTNLYGNRDRNNPNFYVTGEEIRKILGTLFFQGIILKEHRCWSRQQDLGVAIMSNTMSINITK